MTSGNGFDRVRIGNARLDPVTFAEAVQSVVQVAQAPWQGVMQVVTVNAQFVTVAGQEPRLAELINNSALSVADGVPLVWASRLLGTPLPGRVNGTELMVQLCEEAALHGRSVYFFGGRPNAGRLTAERMLARYPNLLIAGVDCPPMGFDKDPRLDAEACTRINAAAPDIVFVALGAPKAEYWIQDHAWLHAKVMIGVGGSFELVGGMTRRAPVSFQKAGCEWLWRLMMEPRRLWKRYLIGNTQFLWIVAGQLLRGGSLRSQSVASR